MKFFGSSLFDGGSSRHGGGGRSSAGDGYLTKSLSRSRGMTALGNRRELACIHTCHPRNIEFSILLIVQHHYILWSSPFQIVNSKVTFSYINLKFQNLQRKSTLHFPVLHNAGGCAMLGLCTKVSHEILSDSKESLTILFHFSSPESSTVQRFLKTNFA